MKGNATTTGDFEKTLFPEGVYPMRLARAFVHWGKPSKFAPEGQAKIAMIWEWADEDGNTFELMDYLTFPKNFGYNEKSNFWKRVSEVAAVAINAQNVGDVDLDLGEFIESYEELVDHIRSTNDQGRPEKAEVKSLKVGSQELIGKSCQLVVKVWQDGDRSGNDVASVMQLGASQRPQRPQRASAPRPAAQEALVTAPPAPRPNTTEPAHAEASPY